jgi:hypothetical protein
MVVINTKYRLVKTVRKDCVAITIVKMRRGKKYHGAYYDANEYAHIEHKKIPKLAIVVKSNCGGWADPVETYDLNGNVIYLK